MFYRSQYDTYRPKFFLLPQEGDSFQKKTYGKWTLEFVPRPTANSHTVTLLITKQVDGVRSCGDIRWNLTYSPAYQSLSFMDMKFSSVAEGKEFLEEVTKAREAEILRARRERAIRRKQEKLAEARARGLSIGEYEEILRAKRLEAREIVKAEKFSEASNIMCRLAGPITLLREAFERYEKACKEAPAHLTFTKVDKTIGGIEYATKAINQWSKRALGKPKKEKAL